MGLLTDPGVEKSMIPAFLFSYHRFLAALFYLIGTAWFLGLAHNSLNHGTYFSENALLPGLVQGEFMGDTNAAHFLHALEHEAERHPNGVPYAWLLAQFTQIGLDTHSHNFTLHYPMGNKVFEGKNIYGILRAVRGSSTESLVVSAPYRPPTSLLPGTGASIALMLALAEFFSEQVYWAKDIIFLVTEHEQLGAQAWLEAYHRSSCGSGVLKAGDLPARAGPIQAAVNLEIGSAFISHIDVKIEGLNGQLPNLDLVNLMHRLCHRESVHHTFKNYDDYPYAYPESFRGWLHQLKTLMSMVATQATGIPNGNHGLFHRFGIASVTVEGIREEGRSRRSASLLQVGRVLEGICRSLNNLLERFHQSFFFYLLPASNRYISIGVYMPPFGFLGGSLLAIALALWYSTSCAANEQEKLRKELEKEGTEQPPWIDYSLMGRLPLLVLTHSLGLLVAASPPRMAFVGAAMGLAPEDSVFLSLVAFLVSFLAIPFFARRLTDLSVSSWEVLKCVVVLELSVVVFAGAVYNFSLALIVTLVYAPAVMIASPSRSLLKKLLRSLLIFLTCPICLLLIFVSIDTYSNFGPLDPEVLLRKSLSATKHALMYAVVDAHVYGNWVFSLACLCVVPMRLSLWFIVWHPTNEGVLACQAEKKAEREKIEKAESEKIEEAGKTEKEIKKADKDMKKVDKDRLGKIKVS